MRKFLVLLLFVSFSVFATDNIYTSLTFTMPRILDNVGRQWPVTTIYGTDNNGNLSPTIPIRLDPSAANLKVDVQNAVLPTGASTEATVLALSSKVPANLTVTANKLQVDGSGVTQPVSGSVSVSNFPSTQSVSGSVSVSNFPASQSVNVSNFPASQPVSGTFFQTTQPVSGPVTDAQLRASAVAVSVSNLPATQAVSGNVSVGNFPATQPVSGPVTDTQMRATPIPVTGSITDTQLRASAVSISGTVTANTGLSQPVTDTQIRATPLPISGTVTANTGLSQAVTDTQLRASPLSVTGTFYQATQPVSGTVTANTGLSQPVTDTQLRATPVGVSGTFFQATQPMSAASLPLPTGASTSANQVTNNSTLSTLNNKVLNNAGGAIVISTSNLYSNQAGAGTTTVKSGAGVLQMICINNNQVGASVTIYDNTAASGTKIFTLTGGTYGGGILSPYQTSGPVCLGPGLGIEFSTGLTVVRTGASSDTTVTYR